MNSLQQTAMLGGSATAKTASYTLVAADAGTVVSVNSTSATTITVNTALFSAGDTVTIQNWGSGAVTITAGTATVNTAGSLIVPQYDGGVLYFTSASAAIYFDFVQAGAVSPLTTKGDLYGFGSSDARIPIGTNGHILTADSAETLGLKWAAPAGGGKVLQVVSATYSTEQSSASATFTTTGLSCAITPSSATSKVLVLYSIAGPRKTDGNLNTSMGMRLRRAGSDIQILGSDMLYTATALTLFGTTASSSYLDSPATTSATTYEVFFNNPNALGSVRVQTSGASSVSSMVLLEIGA
jgi:hypothetical protein